MSSTKRKEAPGGQPPSKAPKKTRESGPTKTDAATKVAKSPAKSAPKTGSKEAAEAKPSAPVVSILKDEEPLFPRGGANVLTPLEQKQIQIEAKADARREEEFNVSSSSSRKKKIKNKAASKSSQKADKKEAEDAVRVESLNFKKLVKGSLLLGQVRRINALDIEVALPNGLTGHVSIVAVSGQLTERLENTPDDDEEDEEDSADETDVDLKDVFAIGQYLRVYVQSTMDETTSGKARRKIQLSLRPADTNTGLEADDVVPNSTLMASVVSVEERGFVMDVGIPKLKAFLPKNEVDEIFQSERLQPGAVFLCHVSSKGANGKIAQLSLLASKLGNAKTAPTDATTINTFLPGTMVDVLVSNTDKRGLTGKILGSLDATADVIHSGAGPDGEDLDSKYKIGSRIKARVICNFPEAKEPKIGISLLDHTKTLSQKRSDKKTPTEVLPISSLVEECTVQQVEAEIGLFVDVGIPGLKGFVHISQVKDGKVDALYESSGPYQTGSKHKGRIISYSDLDGIFHISFEKSVLERQYLRLEDVPLGAVVNCTIEKVVIDENGVSGLILQLCEGITGLVTERHLSDVRLQHPEKKFREGMKVKARVLSTNLSKRQLRLTMKKTLVNSDAPIIATHEQASVGMQVLGTIIKLQNKGAFVHFYGSLRGFLPISEMSETYIRDPSEHFRLGQVVNVHVLDVDPETKRLVVSCKDPAAFGLEKQNALRSLKTGDIVSAKVTQKTEDQVFVELADSSLKAMIPAGQITDKSESKNQFALKRINVGQTLNDLVVIEKVDNRRAITLSMKPSLVQAAKDGKLLSKFEDAKQGDVYPGFVRNVTQTAVFVQFGGNLTALLPRARLPSQVQAQPDFGMHRHQSIEVRIVSIIQDLRRILVAPAASTEPESKEKVKKEEGPAPEDGLVFGSLTKAKVISVKDTQLNVQLLHSQTQGRIEVSQIFDSWDEIEDPKRPLDKFHRKQVLDVRVLGIHDAKDHRFLPLSHRSTHSVLDLTAKASDRKAETLDPLSLSKLKVGDSHIAFVNNVSSQFLWVNLSPVVRGRISAMEASDDLSQLNDLEANFPVGSALKVKVVGVDPSNNHLDLSGRTSGSSSQVGWETLKKNMVLPAKVTKVNERQVIVKLSELISGPVHLPDMSDNYDDINTLNHKKHDIVRVAIVDIDSSNKKLRLSLRPSRIMSSTLPVEDKEITSIEQVSAGDIVRGFVKNVADSGLFVQLGGQVTALVKISNLSDRFLKNWKDSFQKDQLVKGRIVSVDKGTGHIEMSLKSSAVDKDYVSPISFSDISVGQIVTGTVRKVQDFGAFILIDNSNNVSGLCHRSQMAEKPVPDATKLYQEGDKVKAKVLKVDGKKKQITFGLKPSLFEDGDTDMYSDVDAAEDGGAPLLELEEDGDDSDLDLADALDGADNDSEDEMVDEDDEDEDEDEDDESEGESDNEATQSTLLKTTGLGSGKKGEWSADPFADSASEDDKPSKKGEKSSKKRKKAAPDVDRTAELDVNGPQTASDYERLLLGQPDSSELWIAYMAFQMQVSELSKAREVAERAIKSINVREEAEKLNVWVAYMNLEVAYGTKNTAEEVFKRACQYNDEQEVHERMASIYIQSGKTRLAEALFETMVKKFGAKAPSVWMNYAHFLHATLNEPARARALLPRATQQLDKVHRQNIIGRFAALEFRSPNGEPERGRTMFEGLLSAFPKKGDLWNQLLDLEIGIQGDKADPKAVRDVFERRTRVKGLKPQQAEKWFRRWAAWEETVDKKGKEKVMAKAQDWAAAYKARKEAQAANEDIEMEE